MTRSSSLAMRRYSIQPRTRKYVEGYGFLSFTRKYKKQLLDIKLDSLKTTFQKVVHKAGAFLRNKILKNKSNGNNIVKQKPVEEIIILP